MNSKKAKRLRALVRHLQEKGAVGVGEWAVYGSQQHRKMVEPKELPTDENGNPQEPKVQWVVQETRMLDPACGKAIYKQMKKRTENLGHRPK